MKKTKSQKNKAMQPPQGNPAEFEALLRSSMDELLLKTKAHQDSWGFGEEEQWFLDQGSGELVFTFPEVVASGSGQVIGTFDTQAKLWTWAWGDGALPDALKADALQVRDYGVQHGYEHLFTASWQAEETHCWYMAALACWLCHAHGAYRGVSGSLLTFITFRNVTTSAVGAQAEATEEEEVFEEPDFDQFAAEAAEDFKAWAQDPDEQRQACIRYLKRGSLAGLPQDELIHRLGLATPSILDLAGYSPELAESVMGMLKTISDEEIMACAL